MRRPFALAFAALALVSSAGCSPQRTPQPTPPPTPPLIAEPTAPTEPTETELAPLHFVRAEKIGVAGRTIVAGPGIGSRALLAVEALVQGPTAEERGFGLDTAIPAGTRVLAVDVADGVATVNLSSEFESGGGSLSMQLRVAQVVYTLTRFEEIGRVAFEVDGRPVQAIGGEGVVVDPPVERDDFENVTPAILVENPLPGAAIASPVAVSGTSNVFEATHQLELVAPDGTVISETFVTATSGTGTRGSWSAALEFTEPTSGVGTLIAFESSAQDGSRINTVEIPVRFD